ncbi:MAG: hypothetical protein MI802_26875, partial [Desulfobacterales bacterium]|nr:hypothetical protein [Desulfobacterales bacterium]
ITKGKEIENYIPKEAVNSFWNLRSSQQVGQYQSFFEHLNNLKRGEGSRFENKKPMLAEKIVPYMSTKNLIGILDIDHMMKDVIMRIEYWNE